MNDSTKPEDATSYKETAFGIIPRSELVTKESEGIAKGLQYIIEAPKTLPIDSEFLLTLHRICFGWIFPDWAGKYRHIHVETSSHKFPTFTDVPMLMKNFVDDFNERMKHVYDPIELIAWVHHTIVWIHPFNDYNGRTARLFSNYLMLFCDMPIVEIAVENEEMRKKYIEALKAADDNDFGLLQELIRNAFTEDR